MNEPHQPAMEPGSIEALCAAFVKERQNEVETSIESFVGRLDLSNTDGTRLLVRLIRCDIEIRRQQGEQPRAEDYISRFPLVEKDHICDLLTLPAPPPVDINKPLLPARYRPVKELGRGGIGSVWRVHDRQLDRPLAVKVLLDRYRCDTAANARLDREAQLTGSLQHPGIPAVYERGKLVSGSSFFSMKLVGGQTLAEELRARSSSSESLPKFLGVFQQVAQTIAYAHAQGIIHRDLKPHNIMVGEFGEVQIMDWGMAKRLAPPPDGSQRPLPVVPSAASGSSATVLSETDRRQPDPTPTLTRHGDIFGTPAYMPPEQARGDIDAMNRRSDVFGLGAILFEILTGDRLYNDVSDDDVISAAASGDLASSISKLDELSHRPLRVADSLRPWVGGSIDKELLDLCRHCLDPDPQRRPADGHEVADQIGNHLASVDQRLKTAEIERSNAEVKAAEEAKRRRLSTLLAATVLLAVTIGAAATLWYQFDQARRREMNDRNTAETLVEALATAPPDATPYAISSLRAVRPQAIAVLMRAFDEAVDPHRRFQFALALTEFDQPRIHYLVSAIPTLKPTEHSHVHSALRRDPETALSELVTGFHAEAKPSVRARHAWLALNLGDSALAKKMTSDAAKPEDRVEFIALAEVWHGDFQRLVNLAESVDEPLTKFSALAALATVPLASIGESGKDECSPVVTRIVESTPYASVRAAAELVLRRWQQAFPTYAPNESPSDDAEWFANSVGMVMNRIDLPERFPYDSIPVRGYRFFVADRETSITHYRQFLAEDPSTANRMAQPGEHEGKTYAEYVAFDLQFLDDDDLYEHGPMVRVSLYDAYRFCNWLSRREGLIPAYIDRSSESVRNTFGAGGIHGQWVRNPLSNGYRLPNVEEFEYYSGSNSFRNVDSKTYLAADTSHYPRYEWYLKNTQRLQTSATRLPNRYGLFDTMGNLYELSEMLTDHIPDFGRVRNHMLGNSFQSPRLDGTSIITTMSGSVNPESTTGFRVMRMDTDGSLERELNRLSKSRSTLNSLLDDPDNSTDDRVFYADELISLGVEFSNIGEHSSAIECYKASSEAYEKMIAEDLAIGHFEVVVAGNRVNQAISFKALGQFEEALELLGTAEQELIRILEEDSENNTASRFLDNCLWVRARTWLSLADELATHPDPQHRDGARAVDLAEKAIASLGENSADDLAILASAYAEKEDFESAIDWQQESVQKSADNQVRRARELVLEQYRRSEPLRK